MHGLMNTCGRKALPSLLANFYHPSSFQHMASSHQTRFYLEPFSPQNVLFRSKFGKDLTQRELLFDEKARTLKRKERDSQGHTELPMGKSRDASLTSMSMRCLKTTSTQKGLQLIPYSSLANSATLSTIGAFSDEGAQIGRRHFGSQAQSLGGTGGGGGGQGSGGRKYSGESEKYLVKYRLPCAALCLFLMPGVPLIDAILDMFREKNKAKKDEC